MDMKTIQGMAGTISTIMLVGAVISMLWKIYRTRDMHSYSGLQIALNTIATYINLVYVTSLPFGPVYILNIFYAVVNTTMLTSWLYLRRKDARRAARAAHDYVIRASREMDVLRHATVEFPAAQITASR